MLHLPDLLCDLPYSVCAFLFVMRCTEYTTQILSVWVSSSLTLTSKVPDSLLPLYNQFLMCQGQYVLLIQDLR